jgi:hypothetical protein
MNYTNRIPIKISLKDSDNWAGWSWDEDDDQYTDTESFDGSLYGNKTGTSSSEPIISSINFNEQYTDNSLAGFLVDNNMASALSEPTIASIDFNESPTLKSQNFFIKIPKKVKTPRH